MAGIGFDLRKLYGRKTLAASLWGTIYATMTTIDPLVLSVAIMLVIKLLLSWSNASEWEGRFLSAALTYAFLCALLVSSLFSTTVSRYISDLIYREEENKICASAFGVLTLSSTVSAIIMAALCLGMSLSKEGIPLSFLVSYYLFGILVTDTYGIMNYVSALKHYKHISMSYFWGMLTAVASYFVCKHMFGIGIVSSAGISLTVCCLVILMLLLLLGIRTLGLSFHGYFTFLPYFLKYPNLTLCGFAYTLSLYLPTILYWFSSDMAETVNIFRTTPAFDQAMFLAISVNIPSMVIFVVKVETAFYEKYTLYVSALNNGSYALIERARKTMTRMILLQLFFIYEVQLIITVIGICLANVFLLYLSIGAHVLGMFNVLSLGIYAVFSMYYTMIVFHYFADYTGACICSLVFLFVTAPSAVFAARYKIYPLPLLLGGMCGWLLSFLLLVRRLKKLNSFLMC